MKFSSTQTFINVFLTFLLIHSISADLRVEGITCGTKQCRPHEYCSAYNRQCEPCSDICNNQTHNYQASKCMSDCQDYLHDTLYARKNGDQDLNALVHKLQNKTNVSLTLACLSLAILLVVLVLHVWKWKRNNHITFASLRSKLCSKKGDSNNKVSVTTGGAVTNGAPSVSHISGKGDLKLDMPSTTVSQTEHSPATVTTGISRRPAEDSALDYAYDNRAMSSSPSPVANLQDSKF